MKKYIIILNILSKVVFGQDSSSFIQQVISLDATYMHVFYLEYNLNRIKLEFPELKEKINETEMEYNKKFGIARKNIVAYYREILGENDFEKFNKELTKGYEKNITFDIEYAKDFLQRFERDAKGWMRDPILETLLSFQYKDKPEDEFLSGYTNTYNIGSHNKSKWTQWQIKIPKSFKIQESDNKDILISFVNTYRKGFPSIVIMSTEIETDSNLLSKEEIDKFLLIKSLLKTSFEKTITSLERMTIDSLPCALRISEGHFEKGNYIFISGELMFIKDNEFYIVNFTVTVKKQENDINALWDKYFPLFKLITGSIVRFNRDRSN